MADWMSLLPFIGAVVAVATSGAVFMPGEWYKSLDKPVWTPPNWLFGPAWIVLYAMIAAAGWLVWQAPDGRQALFVWGVNLVFNGLWSWLMFSRRQIGAALVDAAAMLVTIVAFIALAMPISSTAAWLFVPYLAWVLFATALNASLFQRNRTRTAA